MDSSTRFAVGLLLLLAIEVLLGGTVVYLVRRWQRVVPEWSWAKMLGAFFLLGLLVSGVGLVPGVGRFAAAIVSLVGLKRLSGLDLLSTLILSLGMGLLVFAIAAALSLQLQVDLLGLER